jgi:hypothetical protein
MRRLVCRSGCSQVSAMEALLAPAFHAGAADLPALKNRHSKPVPAATGLWLYIARLCPARASCRSTSFRLVTACHWAGVAARSWRRLPATPERFPNLPALRLRGCRGAADAGVVEIRIDDALLHQPQGLWRAAGVALASRVDPHPCHRERHCITAQKRRPQDLGVDDAPVPNGGRTASV